MIDMTDVNENRAPSIVAFSVIFIVLSSFTVGLRLLSRRISAANFWWEYVFPESIFPPLFQILSLGHVLGVCTLETCLLRLDIAPQIDNTDGNPAMLSL